jgi:hypothetical protein
MSHEQTVKQFMEWAAREGYAVAVFTPEELGEAEADAVQSRMIESGWDAIDFAHEYNRYNAKENTNEA